MRTRRQPDGSTVSAFRRLPIALAVAGAMSQAAVAGVLTVTNNAAIGAGSLHQAILDANTACSLGDTAPIIRFSGPFTIAQSATLPNFGCANPAGYYPSIDGFTNTGAVANSSAAGWNATLQVAVDGSSNFTGNACAISFQEFGGYGGYLTVKGLEIRNFTYGGNETGLCGRVNVTASVIRGNRHGMSVLSGSVVGGPTLQERNFVPGNSYAGIQFSGVVSIVNNLVNIDFDGTTPYLSGGGDAITSCGCSANSGTISGNTVAASYAGINTGGALSISGNFIGTDPTGAQIVGGSGYVGLQVSSGTGASIVDNVIAGWSYGMVLDRVTNATVSGNKVGTNAAGNQALANGVGITDSYSYGTRIQNNLVSGNAGNGISLEGSTDVVVSGNAIGTNFGASSALGNGTGIYVDSQVTGSSAIDGNYIGGNVYGIFSSFASNVAFRNNQIGVGTSGPIPNDVGMTAECGIGLVIENNNISGNSGIGVHLQGIQSSVVSGNAIGLSGGNGGHGVFVSYDNCGVFDGGFLGAKALRTSKSAKVLIGTAESNSNTFSGNNIVNNSGKGIFIEGGNNNVLFQNRVAGNGIDGVRIDSHYDATPPAYGGPLVISAATGNALVENVIYSNGAKNVNLAFDGGPLPNDAGDGDSGKPNNWQNYPDLASAVYDPINNWTTISFSLDSQPGQYRIDFFANSMPGAPAGDTYLGNTFVTISSPPAAVAPTLVVPGSYSVNGSWNNISAIATRVGPEASPVMDSSEFSPQVAASTLPVPGVTVSPSSVNFGDVVVGRSSGPSVVTVTSTGTAPYVVSSLREGSCSGPAICTSGAFSCSTTCSDGSSWNAGQSCSITASFTPTTVGSQTKTLALCDNAVGSPRTITFTGNGIDVPNVDISYSPASWSFGEVLVGARSAIKTFRLTNSGTNTVYLGPATASGDFSITGGSCSATLAGGASCATDVAYSPSSRGGVNGTLQITGSNTAPATAAALRRKVTTATTTTAVAQLQGSGLQSAAISLPSSVDFGTMVLHSDLRQQNVEIRNTGNGTLAISSITVAGPFTMTNDCGASLVPGASCTIALKFNPANLGGANGTLNVVTDAPGGSRAIALTAQVIADARPVVRVTPTQVGFGNRQIGTESNPQPVTITNEGAQTANLGPLVVTQPENGGGGEAKNEFIVTGTTCAPTLAPQATCVANIVFRALGFGERKGEISVSSNSADSPQKATLSGTGCRPYAAGVNRSGRDPCAP